MINKQIRLPITATSLSLLLLAAMAYMPEATSAPASADYQQFLIDTNKKLLVQLQNKKREAIKLSEELTIARGKIRALEEYIKDLTAQKRTPENSGDSSTRQELPYIAPVKLSMHDLANCKSTTSRSTASPSSTFSPDSLEDVPEPIRPQVAATMDEPASDLSKTTIYKLKKIQHLIAAALNDPPPDGYSGMYGSIVFEIRKDGSPQFSESPVENDEAHRKLRWVIKKAAPFPYCDEPNSSNRIHLELEGGGRGSKPELSLFMVAARDKQATQ